MNLDRCEADDGAAPAPAFPALPALLSIDEVCTVLGVHRNTLRRWRLRDYGPTAQHVGGSWIYREDEVMAWVRPHCHCWQLHVASLSRD